jgi:hypothetical protein
MKRHGLWRTVKRGEFSYLSPWERTHPELPLTIVTCVRRYMRKHKLNTAKEWNALCKIVFDRMGCNRQATLKASQLEARKGYFPVRVEDSLRYPLKRAFWSGNSWEAKYRLQKYLENLDRRGMCFCEGCKKLKPSKGVNNYFQTFYTPNKKDRNKEALSLNACKTCRDQLTRQNKKLLDVEECYTLINNFKKEITNEKRNRTEGFSNTNRRAVAPIYVQHAHGD